MIKIVEHGIPIGFFQERGDAEKALTKYVKSGIIIDDKSR
jgi:hypothetical protein